MREIDLTLFKITGVEDFMQSLSTFLKVISAKIMTSENVVLIFNPWEIRVQFLRYSIFYVSNYSTNFKNCHVMMSISTRDSVYFRVYLLNCTSFGDETVC